MTTRPMVAVVLAAGKGTRMRSALPKVLHRVGGRPLLDWVLDAARGAGCERILVVVGHGAETVQAQIEGEDLRWVQQTELLGTGDALLRAEPQIEGEAMLLVLSGDVPLVSPGTLRRLAELAAASWGAVAVAEVEEPGALGRVTAGPSGQLAGIVEALDATPEELAIRRINAGIYALPAPEIFEYLRALAPDNAKGELYLTDAVTAAAADGHALELLELGDVAESAGINDRRDLARVHRVILERKAEELGTAGVTILEPARTAIEATVEVGSDTEVHPGVSLLGATRVGEGCVLGQGVWIRDSRLGDGVVVEPYSVIDGSEVESDARVGPFARLRPGTLLGEGAKVGNFVEAKNARLGPGAKASHLAYLGDATVGEGANVGAGVVTCNYDGRAKHRTTIGDRAFIGSDTMLVAPVEVGDDATTAAGSVITHDVPDGALGVGRARQRNVEGWAKRKRKTDE